MESPTLLEYAIGAVVGLLSWSAKKADNKIEEIDRELSSHKVHAAANFVHKDDYREDMREVKAGITHIINKLDGKADK